MYGAKYPSRILNDDKVWLGLSFEDLAGSFVVFIVLSKLLNGTMFIWIAFMAPLVCVAILAPIRATRRRKIIRDYIVRSISRGRCYDPKSTIFKTRTKSL